MCELMLEEAEINHHGQAKVDITKSMRPRLAS